MSSVTASPSPVSQTGEADTVGWPKSASLATSPSTENVRSPLGQSVRYVRPSREPKWPVATRVFFYTSGSRTWRRPWWVWGAHCVPPEGKFAHVSISHTQNMPAVKSDESACPLTPPVLLFPSWRSREWRRGWGGDGEMNAAPRPTVGLCV